MQNKIYFFDKFFLKRKLSYIVYSSVNYIYHSVHYIPSTEIWKFVPFDHLHSTSPPRSGNHKFDTLFYKLNFLGGSDDKVSVYNVGDLGSIPGLGRSPGEGNGDPLEKEMAIHSSTIAWKIPWTEEPGRLLSMGSQRVRHD